MVEVLLQSHPQPVIIYDSENLQFLEVNSAAVKLYGYSKDEFAQMDLTDLYAPEDIQTLIKTTEGKSKDGSTTGPWRQKKKDGQSVLVELTKSTLNYKGKKAHLNIIQDVTQKYLTENQLKQYEAVYKSTGDMVFLTDSNGIIQNVNDAVIKKLGRSKKDILSTSLLSLIEDSYRGEINSIIFKKEIKASVSIDTEIKGRQNKLLPVEIIASPVKNIFGLVISYSIVIKIIEEDSTEKNSAGADRSQTKGGFIDPGFFSNMFHELLTPINVIIGFNQELYESIENPDDEQKEAIEIIAENQKLLMEIMDTVAEYAHLKQNEDDLQLSSLTFVDMLQKLENDLKKKAEQSGIEINYGKVSSSLNIESDIQKLNLLLNLFFTLVIKLTKEKKIFISGIFLDKEKCFIGVKDKRSGITEELVNALNDIFTKDEDILRKDYGISKLTHKLIKILMRVLCVESYQIRKDEETVEFGISLPLKFEKDTHSESLQTETIEEKPLPQKQMIEVSSGGNKIDVKETPEIKKPSALSEISCLYLEDQVDSQILFKVQMKDLNKIDFSQSLEDAIPLIKSKKYDLLVMDMNLKGEYNGLDALRIIRKISGYETTPVIACSAYVFPNDRERYKQSGFTDFISKPLMRDKILATLENVFDLVE